MLSSAETNVEEDDGDDGQMKTVDKNTGCSLQSVFNVQETERERERDPWCPCRRRPIVIHEEGSRQGQGLAHSLYQLVSGTHL